MRAVGLITEYNPFHNGHLHHLRESRRVSGAAIAVAVMSGHFLQRGEPALLDKWRRTGMALAAGVDVVLELPLPFACNSAPHFADGAVALLDALGVDALCFGSEAGELAPLQACAALLQSRGGELLAATRAALRAGVPYPRARAAFAAAQLGAAAAALESPNNILGIEYLRALSARGSAIVPHTIPRRGAGYHDLQPQGEIASATGIRRLLAAGEPVAPYLPTAVAVQLAAAREAGALLDSGALHRQLAAQLLAAPQRLETLYQWDAALARRGREAARTAGSMAELAQALKGRQLTLTRVQRLLCYALLDLDASEIARILAAGPPYLRLLGATPRGERFLATTRRRRRLPLLGNLSRAASALARHYGTGSGAAAQARALLELEVRASALYTLLQQHWPGGDRARDWYEAVRRGEEDGV